MRAPSSETTALRMARMLLLFLIAAFFPCSLLARPTPLRTDSREARAIIREKLESLRIQRIEFDKTPVESAIAFLVEESRAADPAREGVNIVLVLPRPSAGAEKADETPRTVTLNLRNVPLLSAIRFVTQVTGLQYHIEAGAVIINTEVKPNGRLETRTFSVAPGLFNSLRSKTD
ncbi:MAG: STN domain-containing protein [Verrucomicrobia bacterium]|nr:STN domain-containing protein [Verrucomicrobiota bacterium]